MNPVMAIDRWPTNAHLIADCARLGYLRSDWLTLDPTYGRGTFWKEWQPTVLFRADLNPLSEDVEKLDFTLLPYPNRFFGAVVFDPPYKLNGTDQGEGERYGVHHVATRDERMGLIRRGLIECARVLGDGFLLVKCQDQVNGGKVRWQTLQIAEWARREGLGLVDRFDLLSYRPQPEGRRQVHARRNASTLLVFKRGWKS